jgi:OOP family OmpA-OmpF porin
LVVVVGSVVLGAGIAAGCQASFRAGGASEPAPASAQPMPSAAPAPQASASAQPAGSSQPAATPAVTQNKQSIQLPGNLVFENDKSTLQAGAENDALLGALKAFLDANPQITKLRIEGHTDNSGDPTANEKLSGERALTVKKWLIDHGVKAERLMSVGFGQNKPIADNGTDAGKAQNRRTEFKIAELNGKKFLGLDPTGGGKVFE